MQTDEPSNLPPKIGWWATLRAGQHYRKSWPQQKSLTPVFKEVHIIKITQFAIRTMPPFVVFTYCWAIMLDASLAIATSAALVAISLPIQCLYWLGKRAHTVLPIGLSSWLSEISENLQQSGIALPEKNGKATYQYLADVLTIAFKQLDDTFLDSL